MTVRELLARMDSRELSEWIAYSNVEPWGEDREDIRHGIRCAVAVNSAFGSKGGAKPADYIPHFGKPRRTTATEARMRFRAYAQGMAGNPKGK